MKFSDNTKGIFLIITSAFSFALMAVFVKLAGDIYFVQKAFFRNFVAFFIAFIGIYRDCKKNNQQFSLAIPKGAFIYVLLRAITGSVGVFGNFYAIDRIVLADAAILNKMAPFFTIIFCYLLLHEKIKFWPFVFIIVAFLGSILIVKPSFDFSKMLPTFVAFLGGMGAGFAYACIRKLKYLECNGKIIILFFSGFSMLLSVPYMIFNFNPMTLSQVIYLCCSGVCAACGQFTITAAYYHAPASKISIYDYSQVIFSTLLGFFFFGQIPDIYSFIGYLIIILMAVANFLYTKKVSEN